MIKITKNLISPESVIEEVRSDSIGCVVTYVGIIRASSQGKKVLSVEYDNSEGDAENILSEIIQEAKQRWQVENIAILHRVGKLRVGEINLVVAVASAHRSDGFTACQYIIDRFKKRLPTKKIETYQDGSIFTENVDIETK